ncbi:MAG: IPT/TIG domain-containing protein [Polyangia bacterium]
MTVRVPKLRRCLPGSALTAALLLSLAPLGGCSPADPCAEVEGTCLSLRLIGEGDVQVDNVQLDLSGAGVTHRFSRDVPSLPAYLPVALGQPVAGTLTIAAFGTRAGMASASGQLQVPISPGLKQALDLVLSPHACAPGDPLPCPPVDPTTSLQPISLTPTSGPTSGGTVVTLGGSGFKQGAKVLFGNVAAPVIEWRSGTELVASTPARPGMLGPADVVITNPDGQKGTLAAAFRYFASLFSVDVKPEVKLPANTSAAFSLAVADA